MGFILPKLTTDVDCTPIGYEGLVVTCWLNLTYEDDPALGSEPWETLFYYGLGRIVECVTFPAEYTDTGEALTIATPDARAVYNLMQSEGFDQQIILWAVNQYHEQRQERMQAEAKN